MHKRNSKTKGEQRLQTSSHPKGEACKIRDHSHLYYVSFRLGTRYITSSEIYSTMTLSRVIKKAFDLCFCTPTTHIKTLLGG